MYVVTDTAAGTSADELCRISHHETSHIKMGSGQQSDSKSGKFCPIMAETVQAGKQGWSWKVSPQIVDNLYGSPGLFPR